MSRDIFYLVAFLPILQNLISFFFITSLTCSEFYLVTLQWRASSKNVGSGTKETESGDLILGWINRRQTLFVLASCNMNTTACTTVSKCVRNVFWQKFVLSVDGIFFHIEAKTKWYRSLLSAVWYFDRTDSEPKIKLYREKVEPVSEKKAGLKRLQVRDTLFPSIICRSGKISS